MAKSDTFTFDVPLALYSDQTKILEQLITRYGDDPINLARTYADLYESPEVKDTNLGRSRDLDWTNDELLERLGNILISSWDSTVHIGGTLTPKKVHPEVVALRQSIVRKRNSTSKTIGSGVMVGQRVLLTAAHVADNQQANQVRFPELAHGHDKHAIVGFVKAEPPADIAAVVLKDSEEERSVVSIAADGSYNLGSKFRSVGFGWLDKKGAKVALRNHVPAIAVMTIDCSEADAIRNYHCEMHKEIVAGALNRTACHNDSGGALLVGSDSGWSLVGIVRRGIVAGCETAARYSRVTAYRDELNEKLRDGGFPEF